MEGVEWHLKSVFAEAHAKHLRVVKNCFNINLINLLAQSCLNLEEGFLVYIASGSGQSHSSTNCGWIKSEAFSYFSVWLALSCISQFSPRIVSCAAVIQVLACSALSLVMQNKTSRPGETLFTRVDTIHWWIMYGGTYSPGGIIHSDNSTV